MPARERTGRTVQTPKRRKNLILDQGKIDRAKALLGVPTETEAIHLALDAVADLAAFRAEMEAGMDALVGGGGFVNRFAGPS